MIQIGAENNNSNYKTNKRTTKVGKLRKMYDMIPAVRQAAFRNAVVAEKGFSQEKSFYNLINRDEAKISAEDRRILVKHFRKVGMNSPFITKKRNAKPTNQKAV